MIENMLLNARAAFSPQRVFDVFFTYLGKDCAPQATPGKAIAPDPAGAESFARLQLS
jgi:hypothetical protein